MNSNYLIYLFGTFASFLASTDGREAIIGGHKTGIDQFPYQVALLDYNHKSFCGGGILDDYSILTAAHCIVDCDGKYYRTRMFILAGTNDVYKFRKPAVIVEIVKVYVSVDFTAENGFFKHGDIAVLKLKRSLKLLRKKHLTRLELPTNKNVSYAGLTATIAGFGWHWIKIENDTEVGGVNDTHLRYAVTHILSPWHSCYVKEINVEKHICAQVKQHHDDLEERGCANGDSGGPLVYDGNVVVGILSFGPFGSAEKEFGAIYTRVSAYLDFITEAMHGNDASDLLRVIDIHK